MIRATRPRRRWLRKAVGGLTGIVVVVGVCLALALFGLNTGVGRARVVTFVNATLSNIFDGRLRIVGLERLGFDGASGVSAELHDAEGRRVAAVRGVQIRVGVVALATELLLEGAASRIDIEQVLVEHAEVDLIEDDVGILRLVTALDTAAAETSSRDEADDTTPSPRVSLGRIRVERALLVGLGHRTLERASAEVSNVEASLLVALPTVRVDVKTAAVTGRDVLEFSAVKGVLGGVVQVIVEEEPLEPFVHVQATFAGSVDELPVEASIDYAAPRWAGELQIRRAPPQALRRWAPSLAVQQPFDVQASFAGTLGLALLDVDVVLGEGQLAARGTLSIDPQLKTELDISIRHLDVHALLPEAPTSSLNLRSHLELTRLPEGYRGNLELSSSNSTLGGAALPETHWVLGMNARELEGQAQIKLPGAPTQVDFELPLGAPGGLTSLSFDMESQLENVAHFSRRLPALAGLSGTGTVSARGVVKRLADAPTLDAVMHASIRDVSFASARATRIVLHGRAWGPLTRPELELAAHATALSAANVSVAELRATATGQPEALQVNVHVPKASLHVPKLELSARLHGPARRLSDVRLALRRKSDTLKVHARTLEWPDSRFVLEGLELRGAGQLDADARLGSTRTEVKARASELDLGALARLFGLQSNELQGIASFDTDLDLAPGQSSGKLSVELRELTIDGVAGARVTSVLELHDGAWTGQFNAHLAKIAELTIDAKDFELPKAWSSSALSGGRGTLDVTGSVQLEKLNRLGLLAGSLTPATGRVTAKARVTRQPGKLALFDATINTKGFGWHPTPDSQQHSASGGRWPGIWRGVEFELHAVLDREADLNIELLGTDARGTLARFKGQSELSGLNLQSLSSTALGRLPFELELEIPRRDLRSLPAALRPPGVDGLGLAGDFRARIEAKGPLSTPIIDANLALTGVGLGRESTSSPGHGQSASSRVEAAPTLNIEGDVHYEQGLATLTAHAESGGKSVLELKGETSLDTAALTRQNWRAQNWDAKLSAAIKDFPLRTLRFLGDGSLDGLMDGEIVLSGIGRRPDARVLLRISPLTSSDLPAQRLSLDATINGERLAARVEVEQAEGRLSASLDAGLLWKGVAVPEIDPAQGVQATIMAKDFRLVTLRPFVPEAQRQLDGLLSADVYLNSTSDTLVTGTASVRDGVLQVPALGQEFRDVQGRVDFERSGLVRLSDGSAKAVAGQLRLEGQAQLERLKFQSGKVSIDVKKRQRIPITLEGVPVGTAWGHVELTATRSDDDIAISLQVPSLHVETPAAAPNTVQPLDPDSSISTGTYLDARRFVAWNIEPRREDALEKKPDPDVELDIVLGKDVWLYRGTTLEARLTGKIKAALGAELSLEGTLSIPEGHVDVQGRLFDIQDSTVTFQPGDAAANPIVIATAHWAAPDGYEVFADFVGPIETGKLSLRSDPPLDDDGIFSLLLFGSPEGQFGASADTDGNPGTATAIGAGGNVIALGLNRQLQELTSLDIRTRVDQSNGSAHPEVAVQISPRVTAELSYDLATPSPGESPDTTFLTLDLRLLRNWSLSTTLGNQGSTFVDMFWRYRY